MVWLYPGGFAISCRFFISNPHDTTAVPPHRAPKKFRLSPNPLLNPLHTLVQGRGWPRTEISVLANGLGLAYHDSPSLDPPKRSFFSGASFASAERQIPSAGKTESRQTAFYAQVADCTASTAKAALFFLRRASRRFHDVEIWGNRPAWKQMPGHIGRVTPSCSPQVSEERPGERRRVGARTVGREPVREPEPPVPFPPPGWIFREWEPVVQGAPQFRRGEANSGPPAPIPQNGEDRERGRTVIRLGPAGRREFPAPPL